MQEQCTADFLSARACVCVYLCVYHTHRPDKYNTSQLISFLQQLLTHGGYYDEHLEFIHIERIQVCVCVCVCVCVGGNVGVCMRYQPESPSFGCEEQIPHEDGMGSSVCMGIVWLMRVCVCVCVCVCTRRSLPP